MHVTHLMDIETISQTYCFGFHVFQVSCQSSRNVLPYFHFQNSRFTSRPQSGLLFDFKTSRTEVLVRADRRTCHHGNFDFERRTKIDRRGHFWVQTSLLCVPGCSEHFSKSSRAKKRGQVPHETKGALHGPHCVALPAEEPEIPYGIRWWRYDFPYKKDCWKEPSGAYVALDCVSVHAASMHAFWRSAWLVLHWRVEKKASLLSVSHFQKDSKNQSAFRGKNGHNYDFFRGCAVWRLTCQSQYTPCVSNVCASNVLVTTWTETLFSHLRRSHIYINIYL